MARYDQQRAAKNPPHVTAKNLRRVAGLTQEQVCESVTEILRLKTPMTRGALSAIESGLRGASREVLDALAITYGLDAGDLVTDFEPRRQPVNA